MELLEPINHSTKHDKIYYKSSDQSCTYGEFHKLINKVITTPRKITLINDQCPLTSLIHLFICLKSETIPVIIPSYFNNDLIKKTFGEPSSYQLFDEYKNFQSSNQKINANVKLGILTSGSTSTPKVCIHSLNSILSSIISFQEHFKIPNGTTIGLSIPHYFSAGLLSLLRGYYLGQDIYYSKNLHDHIKFKTTFISLVPAQCFELLSFPNFGDIKDLFIGGSKINESLIIDLKKRNVNIHLSYGMTEFATTICSRALLNDSSPENVGKALPGKKVKIDQNKNIHIKGNSCFLGYMKNGNINYIDHSAWYKTNDKGYLNSNEELILQGRSDRVIISGGINISLDKIENFATHMNDIHDIYCLPFQHEKWGETPALFYRSNKDKKLLILEHLRRNLLPHEVPKHIINIENHYPEKRKLSYDELISLIKIK